MCSLFHFTGGAGDLTTQSFEFTFKKQPKSLSCLTREIDATLTTDSLDEMIEEEEDPVPGKPNQLDNLSTAHNLRNTKDRCSTMKRSWLQRYVCACFNNAHFGLIIL